MANTISNLKYLIGRKFSDPQVKKDFHSATYRIKARADGGVAVQFLKDYSAYTPEHFTAMMFQQLKAESATKEKDCVLTIPSFFNNSQRAALITAARYAGLNVLRLLNETTATALLHGFNKASLPQTGEESLNVAFVDFSYSQVQASICAFNHGKLRVICTAWGQIGGRDIDVHLANHFAADFQKEYSINAWQNPPVYSRFLTKAHEIKQQMSLLSGEIEVTIDNVVGPLELKSIISTEQFLWQWNDPREKRGGLEQMSQGFK